MSEMHEIERDLERDRAALAESLLALRQRLSPANLVAEGKDALMAQASPLVSRLDGTLRRNPVAATVAGVALAALVFGRRRANDAEAAGAVPAMAGTKFEALSRWEDEGGPPADEPIDPEETWLTEARGLRTKARQLLAQIDDAARRGLAPAALLAKHRADVVAALGRDTRMALAKGLEPLGAAARDQAVQARERIYLAKISVEEKTRVQVESHPVLTGLAMAGAGAALAWLFPQSETEDRLLGEARDTLVDDLTAMARREAVKASDLASTLSRALRSDLDRAASVLAPPRRQDPPVRHH